MNISLIFIVIALILTVASAFTRIPLWVAVLCVVLERLLSLVGGRV